MGMIHYENRCWCVCLGSMWTLKSRNLRIGFILGCLSASISAGIHMFEDFLDDDPISGLVNPAMYSALIGIGGFLVVFRNSQSYARFWEGCSSAHKLLSDLTRLASTSIAFCEHSTCERSAVLAFQQLLIRLVSVLCAMMLADLEGLGAGEEHRAFDFTLIDAEGIDTTSLRALASEPNKAELVLQWIKVLHVHAIQTGVMSIPAPLLARSLGDLDQAFGVYKETTKLAYCPFPFPYAAASEIVLVFISVITPVVVCAWTKEVVAAVVVTFGLVFIFWILHMVAPELENPFGVDDNDLNVSELHQELNSRLLTLVSVAACRLPFLTIPSELAALRADNIKQSLQGEASQSTGMSVCVSQSGTFRSIQRQLTEQSQRNQSSSDSGRFPVTIAQSLANVISEQDVQGVTSGSASTFTRPVASSGPDTGSQREADDLSVQFTRDSSQTPPLTPATWESTRDRPANIWESLARQLRIQGLVRDGVGSSSTSDLHTQM